VRSKKGAAQGDRKLKASPFLARSRTRVRPETTGDCPATLPGAALFLPFHVVLLASRGVDITLDLPNILELLAPEPRVAARDLPTPTFSSPTRSFTFSSPTFTMPTPQNGGFTGVTGTFNTASMESLFSSLDQTAGTGTRTGTRTDTSTSSSATNTASSASGAASQSTPTTFSTSASITSAAASNTVTNNSASNTATNAASNTSGAVTVSKESSCNSISCSSALQAAVAVPIVVAVIAGILLFFFCARRRRKRGGAVVNEKRPAKGGKKKWTRHLRAFSFDAELLMGGRFSSSNSMRSRDPSVRSGAGSSRNGAHSAEPSLHSVEEVAPPYRDAVTHVTPPSPLRTNPAGMTAAGDPIPRPSSTATAPPPYQEPHSPTATRNPFSDSTPVSPIEESPFNDPPDAAGAAASLSRNSSMYRSVLTDDVATPTASDAGSIMEAVVGRRVSVRDGSNAGGGST
jgi:hypothetical protein